MISEEYRAEQTRLHENPGYGVASTHYAPLVTDLINETGITELLDYGAGKGRLASAIKPAHAVEYYPYEPANPDWSDAPDSRQLVCCIDVLEHIEPEHLDSVLDDLRRCTELIGFFTVHTGPAVKTLSDGRNAHLIQQGSSWWLSKLLSRFELLRFVADPHGFTVIVK